MEGANAMRTVVGTLAGMLCDGAKVSCAYKTSTAVATALQGCDLAMDGTALPPGEGILGNTMDETFVHLGRLNNPGMVTADRLMLHMIADGLP